MTQLQRMLYLLFILYMARIDATPQIIFDPHDPIASHPHMQQVVQEIVAQHHDNRRHLADVITSLSTDNKRAILDAHNNIRSLTARGKIETNSGSSKKACGMMHVTMNIHWHRIGQMHVTMNIQTVAKIESPRKYNEAISYIPSNNIP
eukprot:1164124_1